MYTYPEAMNALQSIASDYVKLLMPNKYYQVYVAVSSTAQTASVTWDAISIRIELPARPATVRMTQEEFEDLTSYALHEMGHPTHTNKLDWEQACKAGL